MEFIIQASVITIIFYILWFLGIRKYVPPRIQRFFLIAIIGISLTLPLIENPVHVFLTNKSSFVQNLTTFYIDDLELFATPVYSGEYSVDESYLLPAIRFLYLCGIFMFLMRFFSRLFRIFKLVSNGKTVRRGKFRLIYLKHIDSTFSFFYCIFLSSQTEKCDNYNAIIDHELIHSTHFHSLDVILTELYSILFWFNPFVWLLSRAIKQNHEFIADAGVLNKGYDESEYQITLLNQSLDYPDLKIVSPLNQSLLKKRIIAMSYNKYSNYQNLRLVFIFPVILSILFLFADVPYSQPRQHSEVTFICPLNDGRITAPYGDMMHPYKKKIILHEGIDIAAKKGNHVLASASGIISETGYSKSAGNYVKIVHESKHTTFYSHLNKILISKDEYVKQGDVIAEVGSTGLSTAPHLHFELRIDNKSTDPEDIIDFSTLSQ